MVWISFTSLFFPPRNSTAPEETSLFLSFLPLTSISTTRPFPRNASRQPTRKVGSCSYKTRSFRICGDTLFQKQVDHFCSFHLTFLPPLSFSYMHFFSRCILIHPFLHTTPIIPTHFLPRTLSRLSHFRSRSLPFSLTPIRSPFLFPFSYRFFFFILETIQIPSIMLELQKPGQSAATSEAPGMAARYVSANTTTTRPLHESNS